MWVQGGTRAELEITLGTLKQGLGRSSLASSTRVGTILLCSLGLLSCPLWASRRASPKSIFSRSREVATTGSKAKGLGSMGVPIWVCPLLRPLTGGRKWAFVPSIVNNTAELGLEL